MRKKSGMFSIVLLLVACTTGAGTSEPAEEPKPEGPSAMSISLNQPVQLAKGQTARMEAPESMTLTFIDVPSDSRCPEGVQCVWAGDAEAVFEVRMGDETMEVGLHTHGGAQYPDQRTVAGYTVHLKKLDPYPVEGRKIDPEAYEATVEVTEGTAESPSADM